RARIDSRGGKPRTRTLLRQPAADRRFRRRRRVNQADRADAAGAACRRHGGLRWREAAWIAAGAAAIGLLMLATLAAYGALDAFIAMMRGLMPAYVAMGSPSLHILLRVLLLLLRGTLTWLAPTAGLALAAALSLRTAKSPRARVMIAFALFGLV